jgi:23S rRNA (adenine2503-C2)-methyltransferase
MDFFSLHPDELAEHLGGSGRAKQVWELVRAGTDPATSDQLSDKLRARLTSRFRMRPGVVDARQIALDGTRKLRIALVDACLVEAVVIPSEHRTTVCVSTQVGCARGCLFCATGRMGLARQLSAGEIVYQIHLAQQELRSARLAEVTNVVYMGMGEPLDNFEAVEQSISILTHPQGYRLAPRRITLSTIGPSPEAIRRLQSLPCNLAWSLHAADDEVRRRLIPRIRHGNQESQQAFVEVIQNRRSILLVEMIMIQGINDRESDIDSLMDFWSEHIHSLRFNIIPLNLDPQPGQAAWGPSSPERIGAIRKRLQDAGYFCETRRPRGLDIQAACGQLAGSPRSSSALGENIADS